MKQMFEFTDGLKVVCLIHDDECCIALLLLQKIQKHFISVVVLKVPRITDLYAYDGK